MSPLEFYPAALLALLVSACSGDTPPKPNPSDLSTFGATTVRPLPIGVTMTGNDPVGHIHYINAKIQWMIASPGEPGIASDGYGGACLFVRSPSVCQTDADCTKPAGGDGKCLDKQLVETHVFGQCYTRGPDQNYCMKALANLDGNPMVLGKKYDVPYQGGMQLRGPTKARLITCLNPPKDTWPVGPDGPQPPCGTGTPGALHRVGPTVDIP